MTTPNRFFTQGRQELVDSAVMWQHRAQAAACLAREAAKHPLLCDEALALQERAAAGYSMARYMHKTLLAYEARKAAK